MQSSVVEQLLPPTSPSYLPTHPLSPRLLRDPLLERGLDFLIFNWEKNVAEVVDEIPPSPSLNFDDVPPSLPPPPSLPFSLHPPPSIPCHPDGGEEQKGEAILRII